MPKTNTHFHSATFQAALHDMDDTRVRGGILLLLGHPGTGKSTLLDGYATTRYTSQWAGPVFVYRTEVVNTPLALVQSLLAMLGTRWHGDTRSGLRRLQAELPPGAMLLVDDSHRLALHSLDVLRRLHERTALRLVLAGPPTLPQVLRKKCPALLHRVHGRVTLLDLPAGEVTAYLQTQVRRPAEPLSQTLATNTDGNLYWLDEGLRLARLEARERHRRLTPGLVQQVFDGLERHSA